MRHLPIPEQGRYLRLVVNGFYNYYAVPTNFRAPTPSTTMSWLLAALPSAAQPAAPADVGEDDADRGPLAAEPALRHPFPTGGSRHDPR